ncbi:MAG: hypothetical protein ACRDZ1_00870 [Acidimicrobiia bacterium]
MIAALVVLVVAYVIADAPWVSLAIPAGAIVVLYAIRLWRGGRATRVFAAVTAAATIAATTTVLITPIPIERAWLRHAAGSYSEAVIQFRSEGWPPESFIGVFAPDPREHPQQYQSFTHRSLPAIADAQITLGANGMCQAPVGTIIYRAMLGSGRTYIGELRKNEPANNCRSRWRTVTFTLIKPELALMCELKLPSTTTASSATNEPQCFRFSALT